LTPYAALELAQLRSHGFAEAGAATAGLSVGTQDTRSTLSHLGARLEHRQALGNGMTLAPSLDLAWVHEFSPRRSVTAAFSAAPDVLFTVDGAQAARDALAVKAAAELVLSRNASLHARIGGELSRQATSHSGQVSLLLRW
jgi:outer membrane autotransporter protein